MSTLQPTILLVLSNILLMHANNITSVTSTFPSSIMPTISPTIYFSTDQPTAALSPTVDPMLSLGSIFGVHIIYIFIAALTVIICCIACCLLYFVRQSAQIRELLHKQTIELQSVRNLSYHVQSPAHTSNASILKYKDNESCSQITAFSSPPSIPSNGASNNSHQNTNNQNTNNKNTNNHKMYKQRSVHANTVHVPHNNNMPPPFNKDRSRSKSTQSKYTKPFPHAQQTQFNPYAFNQNIAPRPHGSSLDSNQYYNSQKSIYSQSNHHQSPRQPPPQRPHPMRNRPNPPPQIQIQHRYHSHQNAKQRPMQYPPHPSRSPTSPPYSASTQQYSPGQVPGHHTQLQPRPRSVPVPNQRRPIQIIPPHPNNNKMQQNNNNAQQQMLQLQQMQQKNKHLMSVRSVLTDITDASYETGSSDTDSSTDSDVSTSNEPPPSPQQQRFHVANIALPGQGAMDYLHPNSPDWANSPDGPNSPDLAHSPDSPTNGSRTMVVHEVEEDIDATISVNIVGDDDDSVTL